MVCAKESRHFPCWSVLFACAVFCFCIPQRAFGRLVLFDGALELSGYAREYYLIRTHIPRTEQRFHISNLDLALSSFLVEGLYKISDTGVRTIDFFCGIRYWYEKAPVFDRRLRDGIPAQAYPDHLYPKAAEIINEAYVDIAQGPLRLLMGKQIVVWGETDIVRTADVVNPLDLRYSLPGIDTWDEIKRGLWMVRGFYRTTLPGDVLIEGIFVPGDFQYMQLPSEGTHWGISPVRTSLTPGKGFGFGHWYLEKMRRDAPGWNLRDYHEYGLRLRGYTLDIDWTLFYFNTRSDTPTQNPARSLPFALRYAAAAARGFLLRGRTAPHFPGYEVFRYKRYSVIGGTAQTLIEQLHGSVWRIEWFYEHGQHYNKSSGGQMGIAYDEVKRNSFGAGLNYADKFTLPVITHRWCNDKQLEASITLYYEKIFHYHRDLVVDVSRGHRSGDSHAAMLIWNVVQPILHETWMFIFAGTYNPNGMYFLLPMMSYAPGNHWRLETGAALFGDRSERARHPYGDKDSIILRVRYEW